MQATTNFKSALVLIIPVILFASTVLAKDKPTDSTSTTLVNIANIEETVIIDFPEKGEWKSDYLLQGENDSYMELYFPKGQSSGNWLEMITIEKVGGKRRPNLAGSARIIFLGTRQGCPEAEWKILERGKEDPLHPYIVFEIRCPKYPANKPPEIQIWKLIVGQTGMFTVQYTYKGEEIPERNREEIKKSFDSAYIKTESLEDEKEG